MTYRQGRKYRLGLAAAFVFAALWLLPTSAFAGAVVRDQGCTSNAIPANDDGSSNQVALPFALNFFGRTYSSLWVNNNGNVTFQGPQSIYTPFTIRADTPPIIAPFFADVDTRGPGSGLTTYGTTTYQGHRAFCVNWVNVGYFGAHTDKTNSFQLLLVDRSDISSHDFDAIFNYDRIQWETGDASSGSGGFGGTSAGVGLSNGDGIAAHFSSLLGSLSPGAFLDTNGSTGLTRHSRGSSAVGRYVFEVHNGTVAASHGSYVALGDSYSSGEGLQTYLNGTDQQGDRCHRSSLAYPFRTALALAYRTSDFSFHACSGAKIADFTHANAGNNEPAQNVWLQQAGQNARLVTLSVGGNDASFADAITACYFEAIGIAGRCVGRYDGQVRAAINAMGIFSTTNPLSLTALYLKIAAAAPNAHVLVVGYPRFFPASPPLLCGTGAGGFFIRSQMSWINDRERDMDDVIRTAVAQTHNSRIDYVDTYNAFDGHERCTSSPYLNGIIPHANSDVYVGSFHPNINGQLKLTELIKGRS